MVRAESAADPEGEVPITEVVESLRGRVPAWASGVLSVRSLAGGMTNHNYLVDTPDGAFVLRVGGNNTNMLGVSRDVEHSATTAAARLGIGPDVEAYLLPEQYLVTRFIPGRPIPVDAMRQPRVLRTVATALRRFHLSSRIPGSFWSFRVVERYAETARRHNLPLPPLAEVTMAAARRIETALFNADAGGEGPDSLLCPCHNDLLNANFLDLNGEVRILDWEYAGMGDPYFDLANFSSNHNFSEHDDRALLAAYFEVPAPKPEQYARLQLMRIMSLLREAMWGVVQMAVSEVSFDYGAYAQGYLERLAAQVADPRFADWLLAVSSS